MRVFFYVVLRVLNRVDWSKLPYIVLFQSFRPHQQRKKAASHTTNEIRAQMQRCIDESMKNPLMSYVILCMRLWMFVCGCRTAMINNFSTMSMIIIIQIYTLYRERESIIYIRIFTYIVLNSFTATLPSQLFFSLLLFVVFVVSLVVAVVVVVVLN